MVPKQANLYKQRSVPYELYLQNASRYVKSWRMKMWTDMVGWVWRHQNTWEREMVKIFPKYNTNLL